ncbi:MAG: hypothetical protein V7707_15575 [Motiliproteus sp.]
MKSVKLSNREKLTGKTMLCLLGATLVLPSYADENASNPLAKVKNTDLRLQHFELEGDNYLNDYFIDGAFMASDELKIKYELHYNETDITGSKTQHLESSVVKAIYFAKEGKTDSYGYRLAVGLDWINDLGDTDKGIGSDADLLAPFVGLAMGFEGGTTIIPLVQHFTEYSGTETNRTAFRLIGMQPLPNKSWLKLDTKVPVDWENDNAIPATFELQYGKFVTGKFALYGDVLAGIGSDRPYDWGLGIGARFSY